MRFLQATACAVLVALSACTPNGINASTGGGAGGGVTHTIDVQLTGAIPTTTPYGPAFAYTPEVLTVKVGDSIVFKNTDSFMHTATLIPIAKTSNETKFPAVYPLSGAALNQTGATISNPNWTSGVLQAGGSSQTIVADKAGTYLFGCFYHYSAPPGMRGAIVVK